jgi:1-pyrroline-5-carboxylate dehydrogenase
MSNAKFNVPSPTNEPIHQYKPMSAEKKLLLKELEETRRSCEKVPLVIGGEKLWKERTHRVLEPHKHSSQIGEYQEAEEKDVLAAIEVSCAAGKVWSRMPWEERASVFLKAADLLSTKYRQKMNAATMLAQSKTCFQAEIDAVCELADFFRFNARFAQEIYEEQPVHSPFGQWNRTVNRGLEGFVFAVGPFNFTSISLNLACAPALMGCSVLWKPAPAAVLSSWVGLQFLEEAGLPPGVINLVTGDPSRIGEIALNHRELAGVHFTGSTGTFDYIWGRVGANISNYRNYPRLVGETGGKDFIFAHKSASQEELLVAMLRGAFEYQGQKCSAASRAYIPQSLWKTLKEPLIEQVNQIKMGDPTDFTNFMSAVIDKRSFSKITSYIDHAKVAQDAKILCGGEYDDTEGFFVRPTVIETTNPRYRSMVEEIFGPILTVYVYPDDELEAVLKLCDESTPYALTGAIFARDRSVIESLSETLRYSAGNFYINDKPTGAVVGQQPFGGSRRSGTNDKAGSRTNLLKWVTPQTIKENFLSMTNWRYPHMEEGN